MVAFVPLDVRQEWFDMMVPLFLSDVKGKNSRGGQPEGDVRVNQK